MRLSPTFGTLLLLILGFGTSAHAACTIPNTITNGQIADATQVMVDLNALAACADAKAPAGSTNSVQTNAGSGTFGSVGPLANGQIVIGSTGTAPQAANLTAGPGINITNGPGSVTISTAGGGNGSDIVMALGAAWAKEMVLNGAAITAGTSRSAKADLGAYVGMRMIASTNAGFGSRVVSSVTYTVPTGAVAFVVHGKFLDDERNNASFYGARLFNVTQNRVAAGSYIDANRGVPSQSPGTVSWTFGYSGSLTTGAGGSSPSDVNAYYPLAGSAGDVLQLEEWTNGDGAYRMQDFAVYLVIVNAITGDPIS